MFGDQLIDYVVEQTNLYSVHSTGDSYFCWLQSDRAIYRMAGNDVNN